MCQKQKQFTQLPEEYIVQCESAQESTIVINKVMNYSDRWGHWKYIVVTPEFIRTKSGRLITMIIGDDLKHLPIFTFDQWKELINKPKNMELKITKEKVLAAANSCSTAKVVLQEMFPEAFEKYKLGDRFIESVTDTEYILAQTTPNFVCLISLKDGNRYENPIKVDSIRNITPEEFAIIAGDGCFAKVN